MALLQILATGQERLRYVFFYVFSPLSHSEVWTIWTQKLFLEEQMIVTVKRGLPVMYSATAPERGAPIAARHRF